VAPEVKGVEVPSERERGDYGAEVLPAIREPVEQNQRRTEVRALRIVEDRTSGVVPLLFEQRHDHAICPNVI
jgi:hypothetical protein